MLYFHKSSIANDFYNYGKAEYIYLKNTLLICILKHATFKLNVDFTFVLFKNEELNEKGQEI